MRGMESGLWQTVHITPSSNASQKGPSFYTLKVQTRVDGPCSDATWKEPAYIPRQFRGLLDRLYPWQAQLLASRDVFETRTVHFVFDETGNHGKSTLASLAELHHGALDLPPISDHKELLQVVCDILMAKQERVPGMIFVDLPRSMDPKRLGAFMIAIEQIKKGHVCDVRHHYKDWWFDSPQVWVFANWLPEMKYLSADRWKMHTIDSRNELVPFTPEDRHTFAQFEACVDCVDPGKI
jgi:hypothetical protein